MYLTYTICSEYHNTTEVAYCVPYLHNMLPLPKCYKCSILCTLNTQYAPIIILLPHYHIILPRQHILYPTYTICYNYNNSSEVHIVCFTYIICSKYQNSTEVTYCVPYLHNMLRFSNYFPIIILPSLVPYLQNMLRIS